MTKEELYAHPGWERCTFEGARKQTLLIGLETTFREKIEWLEEMETLTITMRGGDPKTAYTRFDPASQVDSGPVSTF